MRKVYNCRSLSTAQTIRPCRTGAHQSAMAAGAATLIQLIYGMCRAQARLCSDMRPKPLLCHIAGPHLRQKEIINLSFKGQACKITFASASLPEMPGTGRARVLQACKHCPIIESCGMLELGNMLKS